MNDLDILKASLKGETLEKAIMKYNAGTPAAYILGKWEFMGDTYEITRDVLIPRLDTERLVEKLVAILPKNGSFIDIGTGSGCVSISTLKRRPDVIGFAVDVSKKALEVAIRNADSNGVADRLTFFTCDVLKFAPELGDRFDVVVSNPPYIPSLSVDRLDISVRKEPRIALDGGEDGLDFYRAIFPACNKILYPGGKYLFEIGFDQKDAIEALARKYGAGSEFYKDYSGNWRVALLIPDLKQ